MKREESWTEILTQTACDGNNLTFYQFLCHLLQHWLIALQAYISDHIYSEISAQAEVQFSLEKHALTYFIDI